MALSCNPKLLIADEPTTALDVTIQAQILELLNELKESLDMAVIFITHDLGIVAEIADRVLVLYAGRIAEKGFAEDIYNNPKHPYTVGLLNSVPRMDAGQKELSVIGGTLPDGTNLPSGCRFYDRCTRRIDKCLNLPEEINISNGHFAACFNMDE